MIIKNDNLINLDTFLKGVSKDNKTVVIVLSSSLTAEEKKDLFERLKQF